MIKLNGWSNAFKVEYQEIRAIKLKSKREKEYAEEILSINIKEVQLYTCESIDGTVYMARRGTTNYILSKRLYQKLRKELWTTKKSF